MPTNSTSEPSQVLDVVLLPSLIQPESLAGKTVVVVDVLRATTTIINALHNGAEKVLPQPSIEAAHAAHAAHTGEAVLGGERGGQIVDGFHNGNSPVEYTSDVIANKTLILATTNGTVAMERCRSASRVLIGAMVNLGALTDVLIDQPLVTVVCSGTDGWVTSEDVLFGGALMERLIEVKTAAGKPVGKLTDTAKIALNHWKNTKQNTDQADGSENTLADVFRNARGGINLVKIGHDPDIVFASQIDKVPVVAELDLEKWSIRLI